MPQHAKGPRLYRRRDTGIYYVRDTGRREQSTGTRDRRHAETALAKYVAERDRPDSPTTPDRVTVAKALETYGSKYGPTVRAPATIGYSIQALLPFFGSLPVGSITGEVCRRYAKDRGKAAGTVRRNWAFSRPP